MLELDGSGGGGQLVRTALSLSALSGRPFRMTGIRAERPNPGLRPQHLAAIRVLVEATEADVSGATEGSRTLRFQPGPIQSGDYSVDVGTAGSVTLVFDTVLPLTTALEGRLRLRARGGTDVRWAPTMDYFRWVKLPVLRRRGVVAAVDVERRGFYPAGGGEATLTLGPSEVAPIELPASDSSPIARVYSVATGGLAGAEVAERQAVAAVDGLAELGVDVVGRTVEYAAARSPGSAITIRLDRDESIVGVDGLGERGTPAEEVTGTVVERARDLLGSGAAVDGHMADQLLVFLGLSGGEMAIPEVSRHVETSVSLLGEFDHDVGIDRTGTRPVVSA